MCILIRIDDISGIDDINNINDTNENNTMVTNDRDDNSAQKAVRKKKLIRVARSLLICFLPGIIISLVLFVSATVHDIRIQSLRGAVASMDLSPVWIEWYTLE